MSEERAAYVTTATPAPPPDDLARLRPCELEVIRALRAVDCCRAGKIRVLVLRWDGTRMVALDTEQIR